MDYYKDESIIIRDIKESDVVELFSWWTDKKLNQFDPKTMPQNSEDLLKECELFCKRFDQEIISKSRYIYFIICDKDNFPIGFVNVFDIDKMSLECELGIIIGDKIYHGKGIAKRALEVVTHYVFTVLGMKCIRIETAKDNLPAVNLFRKSGFVKTSEEHEDNMEFLVMKKFRQEIINAGASSTQ